MSKQKHSYVPFYIDDWRAGTGDMPRLMWSVYFQVCMYNWDKVEPVPESRLMIMTSDLPGEQTDSIISHLVSDGTLIRDARGVYSERAIHEGQKSRKAWEAKSRGGRHSPTDKKHGTKPEATSEASSADSDSDSDLPRKEGGSNEPPKKAAAAGNGLSVQAGEEMVPAAWNAMAARCKLSPITKMTDERVKRLRERIREHGVNAILAAIESIPDSWFLLGGGERGWKADFDWLVRPEGKKPQPLLQLIEGHWHNEGEGRRNAWLED